MSNSVSSLLLFILVFASIIHGQQLVDGVAAVVENEIILYSEIQQYAQMQAMQMDMNPYQEQEKFQQLQQQILQSLIDQKIILAKAKEDSIEVKEHEVEQALQQQIDNMKTQAGSQEELEQMLGMSVREIKNEYREDVRKRLLVDRYQATKFVDVSVSRREVEQFYNTYKDSIPEMPKRVNISHIVMEVKPSAEADSAAVDTLKFIKKALQQGGNFETFAQQYSQDPGSKNQGGDLGFVSRGTLVPEFEETAFSMQPEQISDIVKTDFGYHLIKLMERRGEKIHVKHILITPTATPVDDQFVVSRLNSLREQIEKGASFDSLARLYSEDTSVELNSGRLGWFEVPNLQVPEFKRVVDSLTAGDISQPFKTDFGWHILKLNDVKPGGTVTLGDNWVELEQMVLQRKQNQMYQEWLTSLRKQFYVDVKIDESRL